MATQDELRDFVRYLYQEELSRRIEGAWTSVGPLNDPFHPYGYVDGRLFGLVEAMQLFRVVETYAQTNRDPLQIVNVQALKASLRDVERATLITAELLSVTGIADVIQDNFSVLADGLNVEDLPEADLEMLRRTGSSDPRMEANALIYQIKALKEQTIREGRETSFAQRIRDIPNQIKRLHDELPSDSTGKPEPPRQPRRWFKGVGGIIKGSIFVLVDGAIATGIWSLPLPVQASTVGIVYSFAEGIGTLFTSAGELRRE